ncbi:winged helix DNA-binding domain-containing protein [Nocardioides sp. GCM10027113]|uniref:winged helix DNA-binding domain-containing protein n=1 Tax=unclassified Nocardioides TaxID=2615069 RepID=UPI00360AB582
MRHVTDRQRRARLAHRHCLAPDSRAADVLAATRAMTVLHATEPASVHLALWARVADVAVADVERALYEDRTLVKQLAMRRTLFAFPRDLLPAAWGSASARVATAEAGRLAREIEKGGLTADGEAWVETARKAALDRLRGGEELTATELREQVPELAGQLTYGTGKSWGGTISVAPRVIGQLGAEGAVVRARNGGHWRTSRPRYCLMEDWLGEPVSPLPEREGYAELVRRWLWTFGPGTETDLRWWLGSTAGAARRALADVGAVPVRLDAHGDRSEDGWLLPDDLDDMPEPEPWAALLPVLDPTVMGWKQRDFYLGPHAGALFDSNGNAGTTAWRDGRVVGCWVQDDDGTVRVVPVEDLAADARRALDAEAARLTGWLGGDKVVTVYSSPAMKAARR